MSKKINPVDEFESDNVDSGDDAPLVIIDSSSDDEDDVNVKPRAAMKKRVIASDSEDEEEIEVKPKATKKKPVVVAAGDDDEDDEEVAVKPKATKKKAAKAADEKKEAKPKIAKKKAKKESTDSDNESTESVKRHIMTPVERIDLVLKKMDESGVTKEVVAQLLRLRKQLDGAKIKQATQTRAPNAYNLWMKEKMAELKGNDMSPKERFVECIRLWNVQKNKKTADADDDE